MTLKDADKIKEAIKNSDDFVGGSDDIIKVIDSVPEVVINTDTDTISRQAAIKALDKRFDSIPMEQTTAILLLRRDLRELPPTNTSEYPNSSDTISRAKAIEALNRECRCGAVIDHCGLETAMDIISELTPAQTAAQIIHEAIDNTTFAEEEYPGIKEQLHRSVEEWEKLQPVFTEIAEEYKKSCEISYINKPLAHALHEVWKKHDRRDTNRNE